MQRVRKAQRIWLDNGILVKNGNQYQFDGYQFHFKFDGLPYCISRNFDRLKDRMLDFYVIIYDKGDVLSIERLVFTDGKIYTGVSSQFVNPDYFLPIWQEIFTDNLMIEEG